MANQDRIVRAQARALLRVVELYNPPVRLESRLGGIWQELEAFGDSGTEADLRRIGRRHAGTAAAAFCGGIRNRAPGSALLLALTSFTKSSPTYRLQDASRWLALMLAFIDNGSKADLDVQTQILDKLVAEFVAEEREEAAVS